MNSASVSGSGVWAVVCAVATVVLGPAAVTASALDRANAAPPHQAVKAGQPAETARPAQSRNRSQSLG
ncbi:hypothetical protein [Streptomyces sp. NPDC000983]|uniref:hypothetical protein n=1 Tax=Streptomyces sp. NPDC000983 TaxID=3154373 RepID=UPI0033304A1F